MAQEYGAINLSQGFPDFDCPQRLRELVSHYLNDRRNQYPPMTGIAQLREQIALKVLDHYGFAADMDLEVTVTSGATEALFDAIQASVTQGDEVIVFDCDLDLCTFYKERVFNFARHRRPEHYGRITSQVGAEPPAE